MVALRNSHRRTKTKGKERTEAEQRHLVARGENDHVDGKAVRSLVGT